MEPMGQGVTDIEKPEELAERLEISFANKLLLSRALTHRSYLNEHPEALEDNERLEFLGDAVLDFLVGAWLYNRYPEMREGRLTRLRSALVRTEQLADFARKIRLGDAMRLGRGEIRAGGRMRDALLCGTFEAFTGALYLDRGLETVQNFLEPMLEAAAQSILSNRGDKDPKSSLQEAVQSQGLTPPIYRTVSASGPEHQKTFVVEVLINGEVKTRGIGHSKQAAAKAAARQALELLDLD